MEFSVNKLSLISEVSHCTLTGHLDVVCGFSALIDDTSFPWAVCLFSELSIWFMHYVSLLSACAWPFHSAPFVIIFNSNAA